MNFEKLPIISVEQPQHEVHAGEEWQWGPSGCQEGFHRGLRIWNFILGILISIGLSCLTSEEGVDDKWVMWELRGISSSGSWCKRAEWKDYLYFNLIYATCAFCLPPKQISLVI